MLRNCFVTTLALLSAHAAVQADDLWQLSDNFNHAPSLSNWQRHHSLYGFPDQAAVLDVDTSTPGALHLEPEVSSWFEDYCSTYLFKPVTGDFVVTTRINVSGLSTPSPQRNFSLAGLMVQAPDSTPDSWQMGEANWLFVSTGTGVGAGVPQFETKDTIDSESELILTPSVSGWLRLRVERSGDTFLLSTRLPGEAWQLQRTIVRSDFPETVHVGMHAYTDWDGLSGTPGGPAVLNPQVLPSPPYQRDLVAQFDWIKFRRPDSDRIKEIRVPQAE